MRPTGGRAARRRAVLVGVLPLLVLCVQLVLAAPVGAEPLTGGFSPTIVGGGADLNGDGVVTASDDSNAFYGGTSIINGLLDCDAWGAIANDGGEGDGAIDAADDCSLVGVDGTPDGVTIEVVDGEFQAPNGPLPKVFNAAEPDNPDVGDSDFAWSAIDGRVDSNGDETIDGDDCHFDLVGTVDILGNPGANECGFVTPPNTADNGLIDLNSDVDITAAGDSCANNCLFGLDVVAGKVQAPECPGFEGDPRHDVIGTSGPDVLIGTSGRDIICARGGNDVLRGLGGNDLLLGANGADQGFGGAGADTARGGAGRDDLRGGSGNDRLFGEAGNDTLLGQLGRDFLNGGPGRDNCNGGPGADTLRSC
jgi:Ca2+-binding RTX toxin-like protein